MVFKKKFFVCLVLGFAMVSTFAEGLYLKHLRTNYVEYEPFENSPEGTRLAKKEKPVIYYGNRASLIDFLSDGYYKVIGVTEWPFAETSLGYQDGTSWLNPAKPSSFHKGVVEFTTEKKYKIAYFENILVDSQDEWYSSSDTYSYQGKISTTSTSRKGTKETYCYNVYFLRLYTKDEMAQWKFGIECRDLDNSEAKGLGRNTGAFISRVFRKFPAYYADMQYGDVVIRIGNKNIRSADDLWALEESIQKGDVVTATILRNGIEMTLDIEI